MRTICALALLALLSGCGQDPGAGSPGGRDPGGGDAATPVVELDGRELVVTRARGHELVEGSAVRMAFEGGQVRVHAGCNHLSGRYELSGDTLRVGMLGGTEMGCPEPLMAQDAWLGEFLTGPVAVAADPVTFTAGGVVLELADREDVLPDAPLTGTRWVLDSMSTGQVVSSVPSGVEAHLTVGKDGSVELFAGCNGAGGEVEVREDVLVWGDLIGTLIACEDERGDVERFVRSVLRGTTEYDVTEQRLTLTHGDRGLGFTAAR